MFEFNVRFKEGINRIMMGLCNIISPKSQTPDNQTYTSHPILESEEILYNFQEILHRHSDLAGEHINGNPVRIGVLTELRDGHPTHLFELIGQVLHTRIAHHKGDLGKGMIICH